MPKPRPLKKIAIPLTKEFRFTLIVWRNLDDLRLANSQYGDDYEALFREEPDGPCIGKLHIEKQISHDLLAHELKHVIDYYTYRATTEQTARMTQECVRTIDAVIEAL